MKTNFIKTKDENLLALYAIGYALKYLRCILVEAQMERIALLGFFEGKKLNSAKLNTLNKKHSKLTNNLFLQKKKIELIA